MKNLKRRRKEMGLTGDELGKLVGVQKSAISKYELGQAQPSQETLLKLAQILDCTTDFLLDRVNDSTPPNQKSTPHPPDIKWSDLDVSFYEGVDLLTDEEKKIILSHMNFLVSEREKNKDKQK